MKQNCERIDRIATSTTKVKMLAAASKAFFTAPEKEEEFDYANAGAALEEEEEE